jgi:hypothetical protein
MQALISLQAMLSSDRTPSAATRTTIEQGACRWRFAGRRHRRAYDHADHHGRRRLRLDALHIVAAMGISDGSTDFKAVFRSMGIPDRWILTPGNSATEIRRAFAVFSQPAVRASQGAQPGGFSN